MCPMCDVSNHKSVLRCTAGVSQSQRCFEAYVAHYYLVNNYSDCSMPDVCVFIYFIYFRFLFSFDETPKQYYYDLK